MSRRVTVYRARREAAAFLPSIEASSTGQRRLISSIRIVAPGDGRLSVRRGMPITRRVSRSGTGSRVNNRELRSSNPVRRRISRNPPFESKLVPSHGNELLFGRRKNAIDEPSDIVLLCGGYAHVSGETARYYCHVAETNATPTPLNETRRCSPGENPTVICRYGSA
jgi:hypothetical protein